MLAMDTRMCCQPSEAGVHSDKSHAGDEFSIKVPKFRQFTFVLLPSRSYQATHTSEGDISE